MTPFEQLQAMREELIVMDPDRITNEDAYGDHAMELLLSLATGTRATIRRKDTPTRKEGAG